MVAVDKVNFEDEVLKTDGLVLVDFWSQKCEPCLALTPAIHALSEKYADKAKFCTLDAGTNKRLSISQKVMGLPTVAFYRGGEKVAELNQSFTAEDVEVKLKELA
ncbi:MAG: thioredoxin family protein [Lachnospiraceae bacterium]|nr:thioredoxin family protein [Lachnospiraceae bacterium]